MKIFKNKIMLVWLFPVGIFFILMLMLETVSLTLLSAGLAMLVFALAMERPKHRMISPGEMDYINHITRTFFYCGIFTVLVCFALLLLSAIAN